MDRILCESGFGTSFKFARSKVGLANWTVSMEARVSQTAVSCLCAARHTLSSRGPAGKVIKVASKGREVIDLTRSLSA